MAGEVLLNSADRSLDCELRGAVATTLSDEGFGYLWSGVRASHGITAGRFWFSVRVLGPLETTVGNIGDSADIYDEDDATANTIHCCRVGVSKLCVDVGALGAHNSWGYGSTGKKSTGNIYTPYPSNRPIGRCFGPGDEVACFVDLVGSRGTAVISYAVNCEMLGVAFELFQPPRPGNAPSALFPHVLVKNLAVVVNLNGERLQHWPQGQEWNGMWGDCLPWQASLQWSIPATPGPCLQPFSDCTVIMMVGLPGAGKSYQAAKLKVAQTGRLQPQGSRTLLHLPSDHQQQQQQGPTGVQQPYQLLSPEAIVKQMKVVGLRRGGGGAAAAAAARTWELLGQAEEVFERLLGLAAHHPGNYIIDCCNVCPEMRQRRLAPFRAAGFRLVAAVVVEQDQVLYKRLTRRDQQLCPAVEDLLDMRANFALPEANSEEFDEVLYLGSIADPLIAAQIVSAQRVSAQQLQLQQQGFNCDTMPATGMPGADASTPPQDCTDTFGAAAAARPLRGASGLDALLLQQGSTRMPRSVSRASSSSSIASTTAAQPNSSHVGALYRPPSTSISPVLERGFGWQQQQYSGTVPPQQDGGTATPQQYGGTAPPQQHSQYAVPYDVAARQRMGSYGPRDHQPSNTIGSSSSSSGLFLQPSTSLGGSRSSSSGVTSTSVYYRQPSWIRPQRSRSPNAAAACTFGAAAAAAPQGGVRGGSSTGSTGSTDTSAGQYTVNCAGCPALTAGAAADVKHNSEQQQWQQHPAVQQQQPQRQRVQQQQQQPAGLWSIPIGSSSKGWGVPPAAAATRVVTAGSHLGNANEEDFPSLSAAVHQSSKHGSTVKVKQQQKGKAEEQTSLQQPKQQQQQQQVEVQQRGQQQQQLQQDKAAEPAYQQQPKQQQWPQPSQAEHHHQQQQQQQQEAPKVVTPPPVSPFAAYQAAAAEAQPSPGGSSQDNAGMAPTRSISGINRAAAEAAAAVSSLLTNHSSTQQQQNGTAVVAVRPSIGPDKPGTSDKVQQQQQQQQQQRRPGDPFHDLFRSSFRSTSTSSSELDAPDVQLSAELQRQLEQLNLPGLSPEALVAAFAGKGPSGNTPRKLGKGSFGVVYGCCLGDLLPGNSSSNSAATSATGAAPAAAPVDNNSSSSNGHAAPASVAAVDAVVAVKVLPPRQCTAAEFVRELEMLTRCRHKYLVALKGYCLSKRVLVFEYCSHGSLEDWLLGNRHFTHGTKLTWQQRLAIAHQVASALMYLHSQPEPIIHRDIKPNNILLTVDHLQHPALRIGSNNLKSAAAAAAAVNGSDGVVQLSARLADVGLSRFLPVNLTSVKSSSSTPGCFYYLPDEYNIWGVVSCGLDAFSYGLTLANIITGDVYTKPRILRCYLSEQLASFESPLAEAAAAAAAAVNCGSRVGELPYKQQISAAVADSSGGGGDGSLMSSNSLWWLGVQANCRKGNSSSRGSSGSGTTTAGGSSGVGSTTVCSSDGPAEVVPAARVSATAGSKVSWASIAASRGPSKTAVAQSKAQPAAAIVVAGKCSSGTAASAPPCSRSPHNSGSIATCAQAAALALPDPATALPTGFRGLLDGSAGEWPPHVAVGLAMLALACSEPERRKRPAMKDVVAALEALQQQP